MPRYFLFGLIRVPMYEYYWGHTAAQIELIDIDQPLTVIKHDNTGKPKPGEKGYVPDARKLDECVQRWKKRKAERDKDGFILDRFLATGEKVPSKDKK